MTGLDSHLVVTISGSWEDADDTGSGEPKAGRAHSHGAVQQRERKQSCWNCSQSCGRGVASDDCCYGRMKGVPGGVEEAAMGVERVVALERVLGRDKTEGWRWG